MKINLHKFTTLVIWKGSNYVNVFSEKYHFCFAFCFALRVTQNHTCFDNLIMNPKIHSLFQDITLINKRKYFVAIFDFFCGGTSEIERIRTLKLVAYFSLRRMMSKI